MKLNIVAMKVALIAFSLLACVRVSSPVFAQARGTPAGVPDDPRFYSVSYIEVNPASRAAALTALRKYRDTVHADTSNIRTEFFEQNDRAGHFVIIETWKTPAAFEARSADRKQLADAVQSMRISDWDTRPYKTLSVLQDVKETDDGAVAVITHVDVSPDSAVAPMLVALAQASRRETGNLRFDVMLHTMRANHFQVIEVWKNRKALDDHAAAEHTKKYRNDLQRFLGSPLDERMFKSVR